MELTIDHVEHLTISLDSQAAASVADLVHFGRITSQADAQAQVAPRVAGSTRPRIGQYWPEQGGVYAGMVRSSNDGPDYCLIVARGSDGGTDDVAWGSAGSTEATSKRDGIANTKVLAESALEFPAADWAYELDLNGFTDWYLPSQGELAVCCANVPEEFDKGWPWSSTQYSDVFAWGQRFADGDQYGTAKLAKGRARAVRRFIP